MGSTLRETGSGMASATSRARRDTLFTFVSSLTRGLGYITEGAGSGEAMPGAEVDKGTLPRA
jgi:hypothetical protein